MDAAMVGKRIAERRKELGFTQKQLAEKLHITDGAVSKWERGINFPDLSLIEPLASAMTDISVTEKEKLVREIKQRAIYSIVCEIILMACLVTASLIFKKYNIYGVAHGITIGALGFVGTLIGSEIFLLRNIGKV